MKNKEAHLKQAIKASIKSSSQMIGATVDLSQQVLMLEAQVTRLKAENNALKSELNFDDLTGLYNARCLRKHLEDSVEDLALSDAKPALLFIDVDYFKEVNETHGHQAAGKVLEQIGRLIGRVTRKGDMAFRYGGDEFVVLLSGGEKGAQLAAQRIRNAVGREVFEVKGLKGWAQVSVTVSVGLCVMKPGDDVSSLLENADRAMFEAKRNSRNTIVAA